jgi:hypothetical protein
LVPAAEQIPARSERQFARPRGERRASTLDLLSYFKSAERYPLGKRSPLDSTVAAINSALNLENVEDSFQITAAKIDNGYELALTPRTASMKRAFQKLDLRINDSLRVERTDMLLPNGDRIVTTYSNQTRAPVPASTFEFNPRVIIGVTGHQIGVIRLGSGINS